MTTERKAEIKLKELFEKAKNNHNIDVYLGVSENVAKETCIQIANSVVDTLLTIQNETSNNVSSELEMWILVKEYANAL